jgi:hypothetical protein
MHVGCGLLVASCPGSCPVQRCLPHCARGLASSPETVGSANGHPAWACRIRPATESQSHVVVIQGLGTRWYFACLRWPPWPVQYEANRLAVSLICRLSGKDMGEGLPSGRENMIPVHLPHKP